MSFDGEPPTNASGESLRTEHLRLRSWRLADREPFARMNRDARVMRHFPRLHTDAESDDFVDRNDRSIRTEGWGNWAVEVVGGEPFIGFVGLSEPAPWHPCAGSMEIGWRLRPAFWGSGYAPEAARAALAIAFDRLGEDEIVSFTAATNTASIAVMRKLGMRDDGVGFEHPRIEAGSPLRTHVAYRLTRARWEEIRETGDGTGRTQRPVA